MTSRTPAEMPARPRGRIPASELQVRERELLDVARALFLEHGFEGVTIDALARAARVSPKTIYGSYGGKEGVFLAALRPVSDRLVATIDVVPTSVRQLEHRLATFGAQLLATALSHDGLRMLRLLTCEAPRFPELARSFYRAGPARGIATLAALFARADAAGLIACRAPHEAAELFLGALLGERLRARLLASEDSDASGMQARARAAARMIVAAYRRR